MVLQYYISSIIWSIIFIILFAVILKIYRKLTTSWCSCNVCLVGKTVIITGANSGIGYETALDLAKRGARIILACRDQEKAENARNKIIQETNNENIIIKLLDLSNLKSVREFADDIIKTEKRLDILINNAGTSGPRPKITEDGLLLVMQINHFSHFLLTNLLLDLLKSSAPSRIINVSSIAARLAKNTFNSNNLNEHLNPHYAYANSKMCQILFTKELARRLNGTNVTTYSLHPGAINTEIFRKARGLLKIFFDIAKLTYFKTPKEGAQTTIHTAIAKNIEHLNGEHFENCKVIPPYALANDMDLAKIVWEKSEQLVKLK